MHRLSSAVQAIERDFLPPQSGLAGTTVAGETLIKIGPTWLPEPMEECANSARYTHRLDSMATRSTAPTTSAWRRRHAGDSEALACR